MIAQAWMAVVSITLPIVIAILGAAWLNNKRMDDLRGEIHADIADIKAVLREVQSTLKDLDRRVTVLEQRLTPIVR